MDELADVVANAGAGAFAKILEYGLLGAMFLLALGAVAFCAWGWNRANRRYIKHLEDHGKDD